LDPVDLSGISFMLAVTEETILDWFRGTAQRAAETIEHLLRELPVTQVQLEQMWNLIERKQAKEGGPVIERTIHQRGWHQWVWISYAPELLQRPQPEEKASLLPPDLLQLPKTR
jgi:predicted Zn-dependent protease